MINFIKYLQIRVKNIKTHRLFHRPCLILPSFCGELAFSSRLVLGLTESGHKHDDESCEHRNTVANPETQENLN
jgi:hypothetical protein